MSTFEFVSVLLSIVISLAFAHLLTGIARLVQAQGVRFSLVYAGWLGIFLFCCLDYWFSLWQTRATQVWTLGYVIFWLVLATMLYLATWLIVPTERAVENGVDLSAYHEANRRKYLGALFLYQILGAAANLSISSLSAAVWLVIPGLASVAAAWLWRDRRVQLAALAIYVAMTAWYASQYVAVL
jgi:TM2 domain-containing membrane protein YozV